MKRKKGIIIATALGMSILLSACGAVRKIEKQTKTEVKTESVTEKRENITKESEDTDTNTAIELKTISEIRENADKSMSILGTDDNPYKNIAGTGVEPIITDKDEIYNITLEKLENNDLEQWGSFDAIISSKKIDSKCSIYRNNTEKIKKKINITEETDAKELIEFVEDYMDNTYTDSPFKWIVESLTVYTTSDKHDYVDVFIRPSYDGVVFTRTLTLNNGIPTNTAADFRGGCLSVIEKDKIEEYHGICPYYNVEKQGEAITKIMSIESVLSMISSKIDKDSVSEIKMFELAYRLKKDLTAVPIWNVVVVEKGNDRNFQIDAVTGDVYFE